ncbi:hypothetical protein BT69DRAFT_1316568 [Atractiella rhizophila]|nr:hypothetical protein BT69DRAFT_1316568 [Atractiella rhizophila]
MASVRTLYQRLDAFTLPVQPTTNPTTHVQTAPLTTVGISADVVPFHIFHNQNLIPDILTAVDQWFAAAARRNPLVDALFQRVSDHCLHEIQVEPLGSDSQTSSAFQCWKGALNHYRGGIRKEGDNSLHRVQCDGILTWQGVSKFMLEYKAVSVFEHHASKIVELSHGPTDQGTALRINPTLEVNERSIIFKLGIKMFHNQTRYGLFFNGLKAIVLEKIEIPSTRQFFLTSSDIYDVVGGQFLKLLFGMTLDDAALPKFDSALIPPIPAALRPPEKYRTSTSTKTSSELIQSDYNLRPRSQNSAPTHPITTVKFPMSCYPDHALQLTKVWTTQCWIAPATQLEVWTFIAAGGGGAVYEGYLVDGQGFYFRVAVKIFDETKNDYFNRESTAYRLLERHHGDIVPMIYGIYTFVEGGGLIVMEFLDGASKCRDVNDVPLKQRWELVAAIDKIHRCGVLHGDIEMRNVDVGDTRCCFYDFSHSWTDEGVATASSMEQETFEVQKLLGLKIVERSEHHYIAYQSQPAKSAAPHEFVTPPVITT